MNILSPDSPCRQPSSVILLARRRVNLVACRAGRDSTRRGACVPPPPLPVPELDGAGHPATAPSLLPGQRAPGRRSRRVPGATRSLSPRQRWVAVGEAKAAPAPEARMRSEMHEQTPAPVRRRVPSTPHAAPSLEDPQVGFVAVSAALVCCLPAMSVRVYCHVRLYVLVASGGGSIRSCAVSRVTVASVCALVVPPTHHTALRWQDFVTKCSQLKRWQSAEHQGMHVERACRWCWVER